MSSEEITIRATNLGKCHHIYDQPQDRLKQSLVPRFQRLLGQPARNYYREFWALTDVSFAIRKGETVGIIGRNGSGKSTLLQIICGTLTPTAGTVDTTGRVAALLEMGSGFNPEFTGRENVLLNAAILGFPPEQMIARMDQVLAFSELGNFLDQPIKTYSSGMYARLAFSAAINVDPEILIIDEALAVGDARFVAKCMRRIKDIQNQGATILFVSHDVGSVRALCDRAIWLDQGRLVGQGDVFPVTGQFMEFMFRGEELAEDTLYQEIATQQLNAIAPGGGEGSDDPADLPTSSGVTPTEAVAITSSGGVDERPVTHWGSHKGIIVSASVCDERSHRKDVHAWGATIKIIIQLRIPEDLPREHMSIAFSIKDLKGTDLIVSTTHDFAVLPIPDGDALTATFTLVNPLVTGKYLLVAAVENREYRDIHYYEYVEGSHYFSSFSNERFFGLFQPPIEQEVLIQ